MAEHVLPDGRAIIEGLVALGRALGYEVAREWAPDGGPAGIDVAYFANDNARAPLLAFEVESTASQGLAANAVKTLGRSSAELPKPLQLFHVVVRGGRRSARPREVASVFSAHNYSIHLMDEPDEPAGLLRAVLDAHRRAAAWVDGVALGLALAGAPWPAGTAAEVMRHAESVGFRGLSAAAYTRLAAQDSGFRLSLCSRLLDLWGPYIEERRPAPSRYNEEGIDHEEAYGSYMAGAECEGLELGIVARLSEPHAERAFEVLRDWQQRNHIGDRLGDFTGAGSQWTEYVIEQMGYYWALLAALFAPVPGARLWCARQPAALLDAVYGVDRESVDLLAAWVLHIAAGLAGSEELYERARTRIECSHGLAAWWLAGPDPVPPAEDAPPLTGDGIAPNAFELHAVVRGQGPPERDAVDLALAALLWEPAYDPSAGRDVVALLAAQAPGAS